MTWRSGQKTFWNQTRLYSLVFLYASSNFMTGSESSPYNCRIWIFDIFYPKFQLLSTFSICSKFCVKNWLLCCDMICKWVTCRSGCKRFWKSALHIKRGESSQSGFQNNSSTDLWTWHFFLDVGSICSHWAFVMQNNGTEIGDTHAQNARR